MPELWTLGATTLIMNPTQEQIVQALPHVRYEVASLLQTPAYDLSNKTLAESVYFRKMAHCRALYTFFTRPVVKRQKLDPNDDDVVSEDHGFQAEALYGAEPKPCLTVSTSGYFTSHIAA